MCWAGAARPFMGQRSPPRDGHSAGRVVGLGQGLGDCWAGHSGIMRSDSHAGTTCLATALLCSGVEAGRQPRTHPGPLGPALEPQATSFSSQHRHPCPPRHFPLPETPRGYSRSPHLATTAVYWESREHECMCVHACVGMSCKSGVSPRHKHSALTLQGTGTGSPGLSSSRGSLQWIQKTRPTLGSFFLQETSPVPGGASVCSLSPRCSGSPLGSLCLSGK